MMNLVQRAAHLNMEGASYLQQDNEQQAMVCFNNALEYMSHAAGQYYCTKLIQQVAAASSSAPAVQTPNVVQPQEQPQQQQRSNVVPLMAIPKPHENEEDETMVFRADDDSADQNEQHFIYDQALVFNPEVARTPVDALFYSAVIIYNTALSFHQRGKCSDPANQAKAASLYDISLELLKESATRFNCSNIIVGALNNKAHLYFKLGEFDKAQSVLDQLMAVMISSRGSQPAFNETDMQGILHNILLLHTASFASAA